MEPIEIQLTPKTPLKIEALNDGRLKVEKDGEIAYYHVVITQGKQNTPLSYDETHMKQIALYIASLAPKYINDGDLSKYCILSQKNKTVVKHTASQTPVEIKETGAHQKLRGILKNRLPPKPPTTSQTLQQQQQQPISTTSNLQKTTTTTTQSTDFTPYTQEEQDLLNSLTGNRYQNERFKGKVAEKAYNNAKNLKRKIYQNGFDQLKKINDTTQPNECRLNQSDLSQFDINQLNYFNNNFTNQTHREAYNKSFFNIAKIKNSGKHHIIVDFANRNIGGGYNKPLGLAQEEYLCMKIPALARYIHKLFKNQLSTETRSNSDKVGQGNPNPVLIKDLSYVQEFKGVYYGHKKFSKVKEMTDILTTVDNPPKVDVLAIAAPDLRHETTQGIETDETTLKDVLNTLIAGFALAKNNAGNQNIVIESGPFGCGVFKNDTIAVGALHILAARYVGVDVVLNGYSSKDQKQVQAAIHACDTLQPQPTNLNAYVKALSQHLKKKMS